MPKEHNISKVVTFWDRLSAISKSCMHVPYLGIYFGTFIIPTHEGRSGREARWRRRRKFKFKVLLMLIIKVDRFTIMRLHE